MKILHIIDSGGLYGAEVVLLNLVAEQIKLGLEPTIASIGEKYIPEKPLETECLKRNFRVIKFRMRPGPNYLGALKILTFAHQEGFDLMHSHGYKGNILFGFMPKKSRKLPLVATIHGWISTGSITKMKLYEWLDAKSLSFIDAVVLVSKGMLSNPKLKNRKRINVYIVNNGIPISNNTSPPTTKQTQQTQTTQSTQQTHVTQVTQILDQSIVAFCKKCFTIGSIGRLSSEKGYTYLIEALDLLVKEGLDVRLVIIGEGYEGNFLKELVEQFDLADRVLMPGYREEAKNYIPFFNVFVFSSLTEGLPITLLEAMQAKVPIVATEVGGIPEVLQNGRAGLLIQPRKPHGLAEAISRLYHDGELAEKLSNVAYHRVTTYYTTKNMALGYLDIYKNLIQHI